MNNSIHLSPVGIVGRAGEPSHEAVARHAAVRLDMSRPADFKSAANAGERKLHAFSRAAGHAGTRLHKAAKMPKSGTGPANARGDEDEEHFGESGAAGAMIAKVAGREGQSSMSDFLRQEQDTYAATVLKRSQTLSDEEKAEAGRRHLEETEASASAATLLARPDRAGDSGIHALYERSRSGGGGTEQWSALAIAESLMAAPSYKEALDSCAQVRRSITRNLELLSPREEFGAKAHDRLRQAREITRFLATLAAAQHLRDELCKSDIAPAPGEMGDLVICRALLKAPRLGEQEVDALLAEIVGADALGNLSARQHADLCAHVGTAVRKKIPVTAWPGAEDMDRRSALLNGLKERESRSHGELAAENSEEARLKQRLADGSRRQGRGS